MYGNVGQLESGEGGREGWRGREGRTSSRGSRELLLLLPGQLCLDGLHAAVVVAVVAWRRRAVYICSVCRALVVGLWEGGGGEGRDE